MISEHRSLVGRQLGSYEVLSLVGRGGMGEVYRARDVRLDRIVALKTLSPDLADAPDLMRQFTREAKAASALNHPNICTIHEIGESDGVRFMMMEYIEGQRLSDWGNARDRTPLEILDLAAQLTDALDEAHGKGIIHRDLKPANVMVTARGNVKILDFGLAKVTGPKPGETELTATQSTANGVVLGTLAYMSPEQVLGGELDARTDLFSFGAVLYELITGRGAFSASNATQTMDRILHSEPEPIARLNYQVPSELERIVLKCLAKDRERRYQSARDLLVDLKNLKRALEPGPRAASTQPKSSPRILVLSLFLMTLLMAAGVGYWAVRSKPAAEEIPDTDMTLTPLTTYPGAEYAPSFSPDGNQVAFVWAEDLTVDNLDICIKLVDSDEYFRLTNTPDRESDPAWSPDGRWIAFWRGRGSKRSLILKSPLGGSERVLTELNAYPLFVWNRLIAWHPNGKWLVVADEPESPARTEGGGLLLLSLESGEQRRLTRAGPGLSDTDPCFSPDGRMLAFTRGTSEPGHSDVFSLNMSDVPAPIGQPKPLTSNGSSLGPAWRNSNELVYASGSFQNWSLFRLRLDDGLRPHRIPSPGPCWGPVFSRSGDRLAFSKGLRDVNVWQMAIQPNETVGPTRLISSTYDDSTPEFSPDGRRIAFASDRSGNPEIWVCESDGSHPVQLTSFGGPETRAPAWSSDGKRIVFASESKGVDHIFTVNAQGGKPLRLTASMAAETYPTYSPDGKWIYFSSTLSGREEIWKVAASGDPSVQVTRHGGTRPRCSPDGRSLYYKKETQQEIGALWRLPADGGEEQKVVDGVLGSSYGFGARGIYFVSCTRWPANSTVEFLPYGTVKARRLAAFTRPPASGLAVSPDEKRLLFAQYDSLGWDLMMIDHFR